jgi:PAS domain S-box-containing protein
MTESSKLTPLREQRELLRSILSSVGDGVITTDLQGRVAFMNQVAETLTGWRNEDAVGEPLDFVFRIVNEETRREVENPALRALRSGTIVGLANHTVLIAKDGTERPIDDSAAPLFDPGGKQTGVVLIFRDVTTRREVERALRASEERFRLLVEGVKDYAIFMLDPNGIVASWNLGAERIKGWRADEIIGQSFSRFYPKDAIEARWPQKELELATADGRFEDEGWRLRKDGSRFWANVVITAIHTESGKLVGFAKVTRDLTERRQLERARAQAEALVELDRRKDEFLAMLSHELRNPLAPLLNAAQLLLLEQANVAVRKEAAAIIERQARSLSRLIDDLLEVSRIATGRIRMQQQRFDVRLGVQHALETIRPQIEARKLRVATALPPMPVWMQADQMRIEQVVMNLLTNAAKYTDPGGSITISLSIETGDAVLRVADTGVGIEPELLPHVFEVFTQGERSLDRAQGGLGIGLAVVKRIVELHGGSVHASSPGRGKGSEFVVRLPIAEETTGAANGELAREGGPRRLKVFVVDDNQDATQMLSALLRVLGHEVATANSGREALSIARQFEADVWLLDIGLPEMDGYELARKIRTTPGLRNAYLVAVTGYGQPTDHERSRAAGFDAHLVKPVLAETLQEVLESRVKRKAAP